MSVPNDTPDDVLPEEDEFDDAQAAAPASDVDLAVGEYDPDAEEGEHAPAATSEAALQAFTIGEKLQDVLKARMAIYLQLDQLDAEREAPLADPDLPDTAKSELQRQRRELLRLPPGDAARAQLERLVKTLTSISEKVKEGDADPIHPRIAEAYRFAFRQWKLCIQRDALQSAVVQAGLDAMPDEPLLALFRTHDIPADAIFGWAAYATAVEATLAEKNARRKVLQMNLTGLDQKNKGLLNRLRRGSADEEEERDRLAGSLEDLGKYIDYLNRERRAVEPGMVKAFWHCYEAAAPLLLRDDLDPDARRRLRLFFRFGAISTAPWLLPAETAESLEGFVDDVVEEVDAGMDAGRVLYADEYIACVAREEITPAIDEDLELNARHTPRWHADRLLRRRIGTRFKETALHQTAARLETQVQQAREEQAKKEAERDNLSRGVKDYKAKLSAVGQEIQHCKVEAGRFQRAIQRIHDTYIPKHVETREEAEAKADTVEYTFSADELARREARAIHRIARLTAKLQDPFPPFSLRDHFKPGANAVNDRATILDAIADVERRDPVIFQEQLTPVKKVAHRIYMRYCPVFLLAPACGFLGYAWNPRAGNEIGRLVLPLYMPRPGLLERILPNVLADFRWDTSKASAGVDLLTSDTLVAAYANVRWEYRRKQRETREKSAIYSEENDRQNFRRHYALHLQSALDGGKKLFFKCPEAYEALLRYLLLPEGVDKHKK